MKSFLYKNTKISYTDSGSGNAIVLLHGYLENSSMWDFCIPTLSVNNRIITLDLLGHGNSECLGYVHTMETQAEVVFTVLRFLSIKRASIVGHSMGGYVALAFAELFPQHLTSLILLNSTTYEDSIERKKNRDRAIKMVKKDHTTFVRLSIANLFNDDIRSKFISDIEIVKTEALKTPLQGIIAALEGMKIRKDRLSVLQDLEIPSLLILSKKDQVLNYEENVKQISNSKTMLITLSNGHMSHIENRVDVLQAVNDFFNRL